MPTLRDVGLWGPTMRQTFSDMGVMEYGAIDLESVMADDESTAEGIDAQRRAQVKQTIAAGQ